MRLVGGGIGIFDSDNLYRVHVLGPPRSLSLSAWWAKVTGAESF